ncbi:UNVERIFIED_CONTAM: SEC1 family transport protein SLY1 [Sesamum radiatum]|uniref:SEC1 family transport protein SLY1 n=1 Tax=Sesamum radiatum TaxID=300843 RepID=A0AAW2S2Q2_SESRA
MVAAGVKNFLSGGQQLALTRTVDVLMEGKPNPELNPILSFYPRAPKSSGNHLRGPFKEAFFFFMIGGGNYVEYASLQELDHQQQPVKHVICGTTETLNGGEFVEQFVMQWHNSRPLRCVSNLTVYGTACGFKRNHSAYT